MKERVEVRHVYACLCAFPTERKREVGGLVGEGHKSALLVLGHSGHPEGPQPNMQVQVKLTCEMMQYDVTEPRLSINPVQFTVLMFLTCVSMGADS